MLIANVEKAVLTQVPFTNLVSLRMSPEPTVPSADRPVPANVSNPAGTSSLLLPRPWQSEDIGSAKTPGEALFAGGLFRLRSSATNIAAGSDAFHFLSKQVKGDSEIIARVVQAPVTHPWAKAGLMMREKLTADSRNVLWPSCHPEAFSNGGPVTGRTPQAKGVETWLCPAGSA